jgi:hypothetical protein
MKVGLNEVPVHGTKRVLNRLYQRNPRTRTYRTCIGNVSYGILLCTPYVFVLRTSTAIGKTPFLLVRDTTTGSTEVPNHRAILVVWFYESMYS